MKNIINGGIYDLNLHGTKDAEFDGNHPTIILKSIKNSEMYYVIPLTTYSEERWKILRRNYCCRITSTNSIARIDKVKVLHRLEIHNRWISNDVFIMPTPEELNAVINRYLEYMNFTTSVAFEDYSKFYNNYNDLYKFLYDTFEEYKFSNDVNFIFSESSTVFTFSISRCSKVMFDDVKHIIYAIIGKNDIINIRFDTENNIILTNIANSYKKMLTLKERYDTFNITKGNDNETSVGIC